MSEPAQAPETPAETVARLGRVKPESLTKGERAALKSAQWEVEKQRVRASKAPPVGADTHTRARDVSVPTDLRAMAETVLRELHASLGELSAYAPKDRASILSLCAKLSGMLDAKEGESVPFTFRGWTQPDVVPPAGADPLECPACHGKGRVEPPSSAAPAA